MTSIAIGSDEESQFFLGEISPFLPPNFFWKMGNYSSLGSQASEPMSIAIIN